MELLLFSTISLSVEMVSPKWTSVAVCLMIPFAVYALECVGTGLVLLHFEPWRIDLQVFFTTPCLLSMVFKSVRSITFAAPGPMYLAY